MADKVKLLGPKALFEQIVEKLTRKAEMECSGSHFQLGWGAKAELGTVNDAIVARVIANLEAKGLVARLEEYEGERFLFLDKKPLDPDAAKVEHFRTEVWKLLSGSIYDRQGQPAELKIDSLFPDHAVEVVVAELRALEWEVDWKREDRRLLVTPKGDAAA